VAGGAATAQLGAAAAAHRTLRRFNAVPVGDLRDHTVTRLDLYTAGVGVVGAVALGLLLRINTSLERLELSEEDITADGRDWSGVAALAAALTGQGATVPGQGIWSVGDGVNRTLRRLTLTERELPLEALEEDEASSVDLSHGGLTDSDAVSLACALRFNTSLTRLDLSHNKLKPLGLRTLAGVLTPDNKNNHGDAPTRPHNTTLTELRLAHNWACGLTSWGAGHRDVSGVMALLAAVWHGSKLAALDVGYNRLGAAGVQSVVAAAAAAAQVGSHAGSASYASPLASSCVLRDATIAVGGCLLMCSFPCGRRAAVGWRSWVWRAVGCRRRRRWRLRAWCARAEEGEEEVVVVVVGEERVRCVRWTCATTRRWARRQPWSWRRRWRRRGRAGRHSTECASPSCW